MKLKFLSIYLFAFCFTAAAQKHNSDSLQVAQLLHELLTICKTAGFSNAEVSKPGVFYKAAPHIIYRGNDKTRAWKVFTDYSKPEDKQRVHEICHKINQTANQDSSGYKISKYYTEKESEGTWHVLMATYTKKGKEKITAYAFLKIGNKFGLGDVD